jgi:uncharacterized protein (TIGR03083 family)
VAVTSELRELGSCYEDGRARIVGLVAEVDDPSSVTVPACPIWSLHDLISHMTGNCADVMRGNVQGVASDEWTAAQVEERKGRSTEDVLAEWAEVAPSFAAMIDDFPGSYGAMTVGDVTVHEHDVRGALGRPDERDSDGIAIATDFLMNVIVHHALTAFGLGPLELRTEDRSWVVGTGGPASGDPDAWQTALLSNDPPDPPGPPAATVSADSFELFRAISGRRSAEQIRRFDWSVDPEPYLAIFGHGPFTVRPSDLNE